jgi:hypothetical protein
MTRPPEHLPNPWLFDTEKVLAELDRCREMVLLIPATTHAAHFATNIAIAALWNLREHVRYLLCLHRDGQSSWAKLHRDLQQSLQEKPIAGAAGMEYKRKINDLEDRIDNLRAQLASLKTHPPLATLPHPPQTINSLTYTIPRQHHATAHPTTQPAVKTLRERSANAGAAPFLPRAA